VTLLTEVIEDTPDGYEGQLWPTYPSAKDTRIAEEIISPGRCVTGVGATNEKGVNLPTTSAGVTTAGLVGVSMFNTAKSEATSDYAENEPLTLVIQGRIWVRAEDVVSDGGDVYVRFQDGDLGRFRSDTDGGDAAQLPSAKFRGSTSAVDELVVVELNLP
jgi:hypothetical protein